MKTTKEKIAVMQAFEDGRRIEGTTRGYNDWSFSDDPVWDWFKYDYRIASEPKLRPWKPEEVPVGALIKFENTVAVISYCNDFQFGFVTYTSQGELDGRGWNYQEVYDLIRHSTDNGKTWHPCGIEE